MRVPVSKTLSATARKATERSATLIGDFATGTSKTYRRFALRTRDGTAGVEQASSKGHYSFRRVVPAAAVGGGLGGLALTQLDDDEPEDRPQDDTPKVESDLDASVLRYADMSPFLREQLKILEADGWTIGYGDIDALGKTYYDAKKIIISTEKKGDPLWATAILAHEVGHSYPGRFGAITDPPTPGEKYGPWLERNMRMRYLEEAEAGLSTARVRREILGNGGPDIGNISDETKSIWAAELSGKLSHDGARDRLADELGRSPYQHYRDALEETWDKNFVATNGPSELLTGDEGVPSLRGDSIDGGDPGHNAHVPAPAPLEPLAPLEPVEPLAPVEPLEPVEPDSPQDAPR
ncbi:hypothetical protein ACWCPQ_11175 [Nocardia sp. NPDC001965]